MLNENIKVIVIISVILIVSNSSYLGWNYKDPETAVLGVGFHVFEWVFVREVPIVLLTAIAGIFLVR